MAMLHETERREYHRMRFEAGIHGIDLEKEIEDETSVEARKNPPKSKGAAKKKESKFLFGDPEEYKKMDPEERQRLTDQMMMFYRGKMTKAMTGGQ